MVPDQPFMKNPRLLLLINSFSKYLLNTYYMQSVVLDHIDDKKIHIY